MKKVFIYLRKSRRDVEAEKRSNVIGDTLARHRKVLVDLARKHGYQVVEIYEEVVSGESIEEREEIKRMLARIEDGGIDAVLVMDTDRLGRGDMSDSGTIERIFRESETLVITPTETYDPTSETWELMWSVKSLVAREELKAITKRMQRGRTTSILEGKSISKKPPYGYTRGEDLVLQPCAETAWVVRKIFELSCAGHGRRSIAKELIRLGIDSPSGDKPWSPSSVVSIIQNEVYIGWLVWGKFRYPKKNGKRVRKKMTPDKWVIVEDAHEPLVSRDVFTKANLAYSNRWSTSEVKDREIRNPLSGLVFCSVCGRRMSMHIRYNRSDGMKCWSVECQGVQKSVTMPVLEAAVLRSLSELLESLEYEPRVRKQVDPGLLKALDTHIASKEAELKELRVRAENTFKFLENGTYTAEMFQERQRIIAEETTAVKRELDDLEAEKRKLTDEGDVVKEEDIDKLRTALEGYERADVRTKNLFLKTVVKQIMYTRKPDWKKPDQFQLEIDTHF